MTDKKYERSKNCTCGVPVDEFPFADEVFQYIRENAHWIKKYAKQYDVPVIAVAGAIADEYNTRFVMHAVQQAVDQLKESVSRIKTSKLNIAKLKKHAGLFFSKAMHASKLTLKQPADFTQDLVIPSSFCNFRKSKRSDIFALCANDEELNVRIEIGYQELIKIDPYNENRPTSIDAIKTFEPRKNFTIWSDYGASNISLRTAIDLYREYKDTFIKERQNYNHAEMLRYLVSNEGNAQFTAISILDAKKKMKELIKNMPEEKQEAILVTFFKQGIKYRRKYEENKKKDPNAIIRSGEGCRTCFQRTRFKENLNGA